MSDSTTSDAVEETTSVGQDDWLNNVSDDETEGAEETAAEETQTEETQGEEAEAEQAESTDETAETDKADKTAENEETAAEGETTEDPEAKEARKQHNIEMARKRIAEKEALQATAQAYVDEATSAVDEFAEDDVRRELAEIKAKEAQRDANDFIRGVELNQSVMANDHARAAAEIPMFNPNSPEYNATAYDRALTHIAPYLITENVQGADGQVHNIIVGTKVPVYDLLRSEADSLTSLLESERSTAAIKGQQAEQKMRSSAEPGSGGTTAKETQVDRETREMKEAFGSR